MSKMKGTAMCITAPPSISALQREDVQLTA